MTEMLTLLEGLERTAGASVEELQALRSRFPIEWPKDYMDCLRWSNGIEGYVRGHGYLWLWSTSDVARLNDAYGVSELAPNLILVGSDAGPSGYGFDTTHVALPFIRVEMAAMHREYVENIASSFAEFVRHLAEAPLAAGEAEPGNFGPPNWLRGKILHEKHPIVMGGDPNDPDNRVLVPRDVHPQLTVFWARAVHRIRKEKQAEG